MRPQATLLCQRLALLIALAVSAMLRLDYASGDPQFCTTGAGCDEVRTSAYSTFLGIGWPVIGMIALGVLILTMLYAQSAVALKRNALLSTVAGAVALGLVGLQLFVIHAVCSLCMIVDAAIVVAAIVSWIRAHDAAKADSPAHEAPALRVLWAATAVAVAALPGFWESPKAKFVDIPPEVAAWRVEGRVNLIVFTDFQCPFCRRLHPIIEELVHANTARLEVTRIMTPLPNHEGAEPAARAYLCTPEALRDRLSDQLYRAEEKALTPAGIEKVVTALGVPPETFRTCLAAAATTAELARHQKLARDAKISGLPATFVEGYFVPGADADRLRDAVARSLSGEQGRDVPWLLVLIASCLGAATTASLVAAKRHP
ncbi:MAG: vitamin K epoxide reductase family protein [Polyangiaceae bacterium]